MSRTPPFAAPVALTLLCFLPAGAAAQKSEKAAPAHQALLRATAVVVSLDAWDKPCGMGTGWLADGEQRLLVTNYHVVGTGAKARVLFPVFVNGEPVVDRNYYMEQLARGNSAAARVMLRHKRTDQAILQLDAVPEWARPLKLAEVPPKKGDKVHSMGSSGRGGYQTFFDHTPRTVSRVGREKWSHGLIEEGRGVWSTQELESNVVVAETRSYPGDSGGPLVNERGELVGVLCSGSPKHTMFIEGSEIREMMTSSGFFARPAAPAATRAESAPSAAKPETREARARLRLRLPEKGTLSVNGVSIPYTGTAVNYSSSLLPAGRPANFRVRVSWEENDRQRSRTETVQAEPGGEAVEVDLSPETAAPEPPESAPAPAAPVDLTVAPPDRRPLMFLIAGVVLIAGPLVYLGFARKAKAVEVPEAAPVEPEEPHTPVRLQMDRWFPPRGRRSAPPDGDRDKPSEGARPA